MVQRLFHTITPMYFWSPVIDCTNLAVITYTTMYIAFKLLFMRIIFVD